MKSVQTWFLKARILLCEAPGFRIQSFRLRAFRYSCLEQCSFFVTVPFSNLPGYPEPQLSSSTTRPKKVQTF